MHWIATSSLALVTLCANPPASAAPLDFQRLEFQTGATAAQPSVTVDPRDGFVITWQEGAGGESALRYALVGPEGRELRRGTVSKGRDRFINAADFPSLAVLDNGDWVTFWLQKTAASTYAYEIRTVRSRTSGQTWDEPVVIHRDGTPTEHGFVSMAPAGGDRARLVWLDGRRMAPKPETKDEPDELMTLRTALLGRDGVPVEEQELDPLTCACCQTDMVRGSSATLALYRDRSPDEIRDIGAVAFKAKAAPELRMVHDDGWKMAGCPVNGPAISARKSRFIAVWPTMASGTMEVRSALGDADGFEAPTTLGKGEGEMGRVDALALPNRTFLASRVTTREGTAALTLSHVDREGKMVWHRVIATPVSGYPRMAVFRNRVLVVYTEPLEGGGSRVGVMIALLERGGELDRDGE